MNPTTTSPTSPPPPPTTTATTSTTTSSTVTVASTTTELINHHPSPASKLPSRPRKHRKLSPSGSTTTTTTITTRPPRPPPPPPPKPLSSPGEITAALTHLRSSDPLLATLISTLPPPTFPSHTSSPFLSLTKSILYQQLALKAGTSIFHRFLSLCGGSESHVTPSSVLSLSPLHLRHIGVSSRKSSYLHDLARKYQSRILSDDAITSMDDKSLFTMLTMVNGIGSWSVHMFMIFSLHRPDVLPANDLGVRKGVQMLYGLDELPRPSQMEQLCDKWRPYRSVAAWYMWRLVESKGGGSTTGNAASVAAVMAAAGSSSSSVQVQQDQQQVQRLMAQSSVQMQQEQQQQRRLLLPPASHEEQQQQQQQQQQKHCVQRLHTPQQLQQQQQQDEQQQKQQQRQQHCVQRLHTPPHLHQQQQQHQQFVDPVNGIVSLGYCSPQT